MTITTREAVQIALNSMAFDYSVMSEGDERDLIRHAAQMLCDKYGLRMNTYFGAEVAK